MKLMGTAKTINLVPKTKQKNKKL